MTWEDILKISTEEAIQDAKRFSPKVVSEAKEDEKKAKKIRQEVTTEWKRLGLVSDMKDIYVPVELEGKDTDMFSEHFYAIIAEPSSFGFKVRIPKYPFKGEFIKVGNTKEAQIQAGKIYMKNYEKAVKEWEAAGNALLD